MPIDHHRLRHALSEVNPDALFLGVGDEFDPALLGTAERDGITVLAYSREGIIRCLTRSGMDRDEAEEWCAFNIEQAHMGPNSPLIVTTGF